MVLQLWPHLAKLRRCMMSLLKNLPFQNEVAGLAAIVMEKKAGEFDVARLETGTENVTVSATGIMTMIETEIGAGAEQDESTQKVQWSKCRFDIM